MQKRLSNKVAIVTGAGQGTGRGIALALAKEGASVMLAGRTASKVESVAKEMEALSLPALAIRCDVANRDDVNAAIETTVKRFGRLDIVVNNAVDGFARIPFEETSEEYFRMAFNVNMLGAFYMLQSAFPHLKQRGGRVINFGSAAGTEGWAMQISYAASKEGVRAMTRVLAKEWGRHGITVNALCPFSQSPNLSEFEHENPEAWNKLIQTVPMGRCGDGEKDVGAMVAFLASDDASFINGQTIMVDGGLFVLR